MINARFIVGQLMAVTALSKIVETGPWTGKDWEDSAAGIKVVNGEPMGMNGDAQKRIDAPKPVDGALGDYKQQANVKLLESFFTQENFEYLFPKRNAIYTYDAFVKAVAKFPHFCGENHAAGVSDKDTCARELSSLFAHMVQETSFGSQWEADNKGIHLYRQGLYWLEEVACQDGKGGWACNYAADWGWAGQAWPVQAGKRYFGRGPFQLSWNYNYGPFSTVFEESTYDAKMALLKDPDQITKDGYTAFSTALWFYMTPQSPKPSMHDVMSGLFKPNEVDKNLGITGGFGTTINIINGGLECGKGAESKKAANRGAYYKEFLTYFKLAQESDLGCGGEKPFKAGGAGDLKAYFQKGTESGKCQLVSW